VVSINLGSALAISLFPLYGTQGMLFLRMALGVALFSAAIPYLFEYLALKPIPTRRFGVLVALEPVAAAIVGAIALAQWLDLNTWASVVLISSASLITSWVPASADSES
jgi:inner membrane transporter RhtA